MCLHVTPSIWDSNVYLSVNSQVGVCCMQRRCPAMDQDIHELQILMGHLPLLLYPISYSNQTWAPAKTQLTGSWAQWTGADGSWHISRKRAKAGFCDLLRKCTAMSRCLEREYFAGGFAQVTNDSWPQQENGVSLSSRKHSLPSSILHVFSVRAEPNALKNEQWGRDRKAVVHVEFKKKKKYFSLQENKWLWWIV